MLVKGTKTFIGVLVGLCLVILHSLGILTTDQFNMLIAVTGFGTAAALRDALTTEAIKTELVIKNYLQAHGIGQPDPTPVIEQAPVVEAPPEG